MGIIRKTKPVKTLLEVFGHSDKAFSSVHLIELFKVQMNKTTIYRVVERLEDAGILHSFKGKDGLKWYAKCKGCSSLHHSDLHPHFQYRNCSKTEYLNLDFSIPVLPNHRIDEVELLLIGQCEDCVA